MLYCEWRISFETGSLGTEYNLMPCIRWVIICIWFFFLLFLELISLKANTQADKQCPSRGLSKVGQQGIKDGRCTKVKRWKLYSYSPPGYLRILNCWLILTPSFCFLFLALVCEPLLFIWACNVFLEISHCIC